DRRDGVFIHFKPNGVAAVLGIRALELSSRVVDLPLIWNGTESLMGRLSEASTWPQRFAILDQVFLKMLKPIQTAPELSWAWEQLANSRGCIPVHLLAGKIGWSRQHFRKRFLHEFGTTPKIAGRIFRFRSAARLLKTGRRGLAEVAAECGFYDQ